MVWIVFPQPNTGDTVPERIGTKWNHRAILGNRRRRAKDRMPAPGQLVSAGRHKPNPSRLAEIAGFAHAPGWTGWGAAYDLSRSGCYFSAKAA